MKKIPQQAFTAEFKELAVRRVKEGQTIPAVGRELGISHQTVRNWDNAPTESWFNSFKNERIHGVRYATHAAMKAISFEYIEVFYNRQRQHSTLGYRSPTRYLERWMQEQEKKAA